MNGIVSVLGAFVRLMQFLSNYLHRAKPCVEIVEFPSPKVIQLRPGVRLLNNGANLKIKKIICSPNDFIVGLPPNYSEDWINGDYKIYALEERYFPLKEKVEVCIIVEDYNSYHFCIYLSYIGDRLEIEKTTNYSLFHKMKTRWRTSKSHQRRKR